MSDRAASHVSAAELRDAQEGRLKQVYEVSMCRAAAMADFKLATHKKDGSTPHHSAAI